MTREATDSPFAASILAVININMVVSKLKEQKGLHYLELLPGLKGDVGKVALGPRSSLQELLHMRLLYKG